MTAPQAQLALPGFKTLLFGDSGDGKTHVIRTLLRHGITPIVQATEPGMRALAPCDNPACAVCKDTRGTPPIPWSYIAPVGGDIKALIQQASEVSRFDQKALCNIVDNQRSKNYDQFSQLLKNFETFTDAGGKSWGAPLTWATDRCYVLDGLTQAGTMAMNLFAGRRPLYDKPDYQIAQKILLEFIKLLTCGMRAHVVVIAHVDFGEDVMGRPKGTVLAPGRKLAPELPALFDDMVLATREGDKFAWTTSKFGMQAKGRNLPYKDGMVPDFGAIVESWKRAGGQIQPTEVK